MSRRPDETRQIETFLRKLREDEVLPEVAAPASFQGELRDYQRTGLRGCSTCAARAWPASWPTTWAWARRCRRWRTCCSRSRRAGSTGPALVVAPTSLVGNWRREAGALRARTCACCVLHGAERAETQSTQVGSCDVVADHLPAARARRRAAARQRSHLVVLDEAQAIKNPRSQARRALRGAAGRATACA